MCIIFRKIYDATIDCVVVLLKNHVFDYTSQKEKHFLKMSDKTRTCEKICKIVQ